MVFLGWMLPLSLQEAVHFIVSLSTAAVTPALSYRKTASFESFRTVFAFHFNLTFFHGRVSKRYTSWRVQTFNAIKLPCSENNNMGTVFSRLRRWINRYIFFLLYSLGYLTTVYPPFAWKPLLQDFLHGGRDVFYWVFLLDAEGLYLFYSRVISIDFAS